LPPSCPGMPGWSLLWATTPLDEKCFPLVCLYCYSRAWVLVAVANGPRLRSALLESQTFPNIPNVRRVSWGLGIGDGGATNVPLHGALALRVTTHTKPGLGVPSVPWGAVWCLRRPSPLVFGFQPPPWIELPPPSIPLGARGWERESRAGTSLRVDAVAAAAAAAAARGGGDRASSSKTEAAGRRCPHHRQGEGSEAPGERPWRGGGCIYSMTGGGSPTPRRVLWTLAGFEPRSGRGALTNEPPPPPLHTQRVPTLTRCETQGGWTRHVPLPSCNFYRDQ